MKRDMELVRAILLAIEASPTPELDSQPLISGWSDAQVNEHLRLLYETGYVTATRYDGGDRTTFGWIRLLWPGHEFLAAARDDTIWKKAKAHLGGTFDAVTPGVLFALLVALGRGAVGLAP